VVLSGTAIVGLVVGSTFAVSSVLSATSESGARTQLVADTSGNIVVSRGDVRPPEVELPSAPPAAEVEVTDASFVFHDDAADLYNMPDATSNVIVVIPPDAKVGTTGSVSGDYTQVVYADKVGWVKTKSLVTGRPLSKTACKSGSGVEKGLQPDTIRVHRVVCALFPQITRFGGRSGGGEHATGQALDIMTKDVELGTTIATVMRAHAKELGVSQVIWRQHIWTVQMSGGGWRPMKDRGSSTANHMDHVHVTTYGNRGTL
jgi:hypothetical protein